LFVVCFVVSGLYEEPLTRSEVLYANIVACVSLYDLGFQAMKRSRPELGLCTTTKTNWLNVAATLCSGKKSPLHTASENIWTPQTSGHFGKEISLISMGLGKIFCGIVTVPSELSRLNLSKQGMFCNAMECGKECRVCGLNPFQKHSTPLIIAETISSSIFTPRVRTRWRHDMRIGPFHAIRHVFLVV